MRETGLAESKMISIIIPVYNAEKTLFRCVSSVVGQEWQNLQIILVNDGSTDGSAEVCEKFAAQDKRVQVHHIENGGLVIARKFGMKLAKGTYIGFVDADDYIESDLYIGLLRVIVETGADLVHSGYVEERNNSKKVVCNCENQIV